MYVRLEMRGVMTLNIHFNNKTTINIADICVAKTFMQRLRGLMFRKEIGCGAMVFYNCSSIHTCFVKFPIDVLYLDERMNVISYVRNLKPWRTSRSNLGASIVIELPANTLTHKPFCAVLENDTSK